MLNILGGSGEALRRHLIAGARQGGKMLVIVPEQYTLQTERDLMDGLQVPGFFDLEVLSPSRLKERIFSLAGADGRIAIDARGKQLALAKALMGCRKELKYYESAAQKQGFIQRAGALIADFKRAGVTPEQLQIYMETMEEGAARDKFHDLAMIYTAYEGQLAGQFVDGEDVQECMLSRLPESGIALDARIVIYGFDVFTGQMNRLILALAFQARETEALIVMGREEYFAPVWESARRLEKEAMDAGIACRLSLLAAAKEEKQPELSHLSRCYLSSPAQPYDGPCPAIRLYAAPNPYFEAHFAAQEMLLLHEQGMEFGEMAVIMGDPAFAGTLDTVLKSYRIPAYVARKLPMLSHGAARFLLSSLKAAGGNYEAQDMLAILHSGYAPISEMDAWKLENYLLSYGIRGKHWLAPFQRGKAEECADLEAARCMLMEPLEALRLAVKDADNVDASLHAIYDYLAETRVYHQLTDQQEKLLAQDMPAQAVQSRQVWETILQLINQAHAILQGEKVNARNLALWLEAGLEECNLSALPPMADGVMCGEAGGLPLSRPKILFLMNMTDGLISSGENGLLTADEQEHAQKALDAYFSLDDDGRDALAFLDIWKALAAPTEKLYLTRAQATQDGSALRPFAGLNHIRRLFPQLIEEGGVSQKMASPLPLAPGPALDSMGARLRMGPLDRDWLEAWKYLSQAPETRHQARALCQSFLPEKEARPLPREVTQSLFMERIMSVSRLEKFAVCPYKHFVEQGLSPQPRKEWTLTPIDAGNFYHSALEGFTRLLPAIENWPQIDKKACEAAVDQAAQPLFDQLLSGAMGDTARMRALGEKYKRVLRRVAWTFTLGARKSAFSTECAEVRFGYAGGIPPIELTLSDGRKVFVRGIIDRIDRYAGDEGVYLRVVDYKSGDNQLQPARIFWGAQLQLLLYLQAALSMEEGAVPAGAFYMRLHDPLLTTREETEQLEEALARALHLKGVALRDAAILKKMDDGTPPLSLPKMLTASGEFDKRAMLADLDALSGLIRHAGKMAGEMARRMHQGEIAASPLCDKDGKGPCEYCDYAGICRKGGAKTPENARIMPDMKWDELLENVNKNSAGNSEENQV